MLAEARHTVQARRRRAYFSEGASAACSRYLRAAKAVDEATAHRTVVQRERTTTITEDQREERACSDAWERCFLAAVEVDALAPDPAETAADLVRVLASLFSASEGAWTPYVNADGSRHFTDGRGRVTALLTASGEIVRGPWFMEGQTLPASPL
jgi:hypothetical protein